MRDAAVVSLCVDPDGVLERESVGISARTEDGLETAVRKLSEDREALAGFARRGRAYAEKHHSLANAGRLIELLADATQRPTAGTGVTKES